MYRYLEHFESLLTRTDDPLAALLGEEEDETVEAEPDEEEQA